MFNTRRVIIKNAPCSLTIFVLFFMKFGDNYYSFFSFFFGRRDVLPCKNWEKFIVFIKNLISSIKFKFLFNLLWYKTKCCMSLFRGNLKRKKLFAFTFVNLFKWVKLYVNFEPRPVFRWKGKWDDDERGQRKQKNN